MSLDFENWKEYSFDEIFEIRKGFYNKKPEHTTKGYIPFLGATEKNNGITEYYTIDEIENSTKTGDGKNAPLEEKIFPPKALCVTNNGSVGYAFYQEEAFTCSHDVNPLYLLEGEFNRYTALFIATVIQHDRYRWAYGRKWRPERMKKSTILLPSTNEGKLDLDYMEKFMKTLHYKTLTTSNTNNNLDLNLKDWQEFKLGDLLDTIYKSKAYVKGEMEITDYRDENAIKFISRTEENNGCDCYVVNSNLEDIEEGNALIIGDTTATIFYQEEKFITGDHIIICRADWINPYTALFVKTVLEKERYKYSYGRAFKMDFVKNTILKLPTNEKGNPDWEFMEKYIKQLPFGDKI